MASRLGLGAQPGTPLGPYFVGKLLGRAMHDLPTTRRTASLEQAVAHDKAARRVLGAAGDAAREQVDARLAAAEAERAAG